MNTPQNLRTCRRAIVLILAGSIAALLSAPLPAQTTITYTNGQTDATGHSITAPNDPTTLTIATGAATQSGVLSGTGSVIKTGAGTLTLSGANTFIGPVAVNAGTLNIYHDTNLGTAGNAVTLAGGTLQSSSTYSSHPLAISSASNVDVGGTQGSVVFTTLQNAALTGSGALTKTGGGTFFLAAGSGNTFSGDIMLAVNGGTLQVGSAAPSTTLGGAKLASLTSANTITVNRGGTFSIQENDSTTARNGYLADRLGTAGNRPAVALAGGTFNLNGANNAATMTQTVGPLILTGSSAITVTRNLAGTPELIFSNLNRAFGAFANFTGTALGSGTNDGRILFTSAPALVGGGGAAGTTTMSILPGARAGIIGPGSDLATYGANGVRPLTAAEYNVAAANNINGAGATENVKISDAATSAFAALSGPTTINGLVITAAVNATWAMGNTLTLTSGQLIDTAANTLNISSGALTAGTGAAGAAEFDVTITSTTVTLGANVNDNGSTSVALIKNGSAQLTLSSNSSNTYSGGTVINQGPITTGITANRRYLGTGPVVLNSGASLALNVAGATSFAGSAASPTYTVKTGGSIFLSPAPASNEFFKLESGAVLRVSGTTSAGGLNIAGATPNLNAAPGAVLAEIVAGANVAIRNGAGVITSLTTPTYYFGLAVSNIQENITVGAGTPWLGISTDRSFSSYAGAASTNNTITGNSDFNLQGLLGAGDPGFTLSLGSGASATNIIKIATPNGSVNANIVGAVSLNNDNSQYGSGGNTVTFQVTPGATLTANTATAMGVVGGAAVAPASIVVQSGGTLTIGNGAAINGNVTILPGGMFTQSQTTLTGTGTFIHSNGSILNLPFFATAVSGATQAFGTVPGTIVRLSVTGLLPGTSAGGVTQFDSRLHDAAVCELTTNVTMGAAAAATDSLFTLSASGGIGGVLINDFSGSRTLGGTTGRIVIGSGGGTFAATTNTGFGVNEDFALGTNTLTIGSNQTYDGNPKLGTVNLGAAAGANTGSPGSVISVLARAGLILTANDQIPDATRFTVNSTSIVNMNSRSDTVESLTGGGTITNTGTAATVTVSPTTTDANFSGILSSTTPANVALTKTNTGTQTLSGANTYAGNTTVSQGRLALTGSGSFASSPSIAIAAGATLDVSGVTGGAYYDGTRFAVVSGQTLKGTGTVLGAMDVSAGGTIAPGNSIGTLAIGGLSLTSATSHFALEIDLGLTPAADLLNVTGAIALAGSTLDLSLFNLSPMSLPETFLFAADDLSDPVTGIFGTITGVPNGYTATVDYAYTGTDALGRIGDGNDLAVTLVAALPEPGTAIFGLALFAVLGVRRRARR